MDDQKQQIDSIVRGVASRPEKDDPRLQSQEKPSKASTKNGPLHFNEYERGFHEGVRMSQGGFVKIWRSIYSDLDMKQMPSACTVFMHLIVQANWKDSKARFNGQYRTVKRGQVITGRKVIAEQTGLPESTVYKALKHLESSSRISIESDSRGTMVTIRNYGKYQDNRSDEEQLSNSPVTTEEQLSSTPWKEGKKGRSKEGKKVEDLGPSDPPSAGGAAPAIAGEGNQEGFALEPQPAVEPKAEPSPERQKQIELAIWREGLYLFSKLCYAECGLDLGVYPVLKGKVSGLLGTYIKKLGGENYREGAKKLHAVFSINSDWYEEKGDYWHPSVSSILANGDKVGRLLAKMDPDGLGGFPDSAVDYKARCRQLLDEQMAETH